jgi:cell division GTPase FtsZ
LGTNVLVVGVGQAGGKAAGALLEYEARTRTSFVSDGLAVNTARVDLLGLKAVDVEHRLLIGQSRVKGHGVGADDQTGIEIARRFGVLFSAGESRSGVVPETVVDASEIVNTLSGGGISTVGYATSKLDRAEMGILSRLGGKRAEVDELDAVNRITSTVRRAALGRLTLPCDVHSAGRALVVVSGPPEYLSRKGIENARRWLEESTGTMEIRGGDYPVPDSEHVAALVLLSGIRNAPRLDELDAIAVETRENLAAIEAENANRLRAPWEGEGGIDPLF